ncbi:MAG: class I SAM-dependent methyltransferase [Kordiimonadaceae bacterium]|nr:class I SAM-dependent methyltransferase [Kordiimonadaceae bacterium]
MFNDLVGLNKRPDPFSVYTVDVLWTDPHISARMLDFHLDAGSNRASRRAASIEGTIGWMDRRFSFKDKSVCDLGCGPGLYSAQMAQRGARVTGVDFSPCSIDYARKTARETGLPLTFNKSDYLKDDLPAEQDIVCLIFCDLCTLSPTQRKVLYNKVHKSLKPGGHFVFDVYSVAQFHQRQEGASYGRRLMDGFWAEGDYFGFMTTFLYGDQKLALDRYLIVEPARRREIFNWLQYFDADTITRELNDNGFCVEQIVDVFSGEQPQTSAGEYAIIARR